MANRLLSVGSVFPEFKKTSVVSLEKGNEFYIFFKRPKMVKKLFGLIKNMDDNFTSDRTGQTSNDVRDAVTALINDDIATLENA